MTRGKQTCKILKEIRRQIAEANEGHMRKRVAYA